MLIIQQLEQRRLLSATLDHGWLTIHGTGGNESIVVSDMGGSVMVSMRSHVFQFPVADVQLVIIYGGKGDDTIDCGRSPTACFVRGQSGNDIIFGSNSDDTLIGGRGNDAIGGQNGNDLVVGNDGRDNLSGGNGNDQVFGIKGRDQLHGDDGDDLLVGGMGNDLVFGDAGADKLSENNEYWVPQFDDCALPTPPTFAGRTTNSLFTEPRLFVALSSNRFQPIPDGSDTLWGGTGIDTVSYGRRNLALKLSLDGKRNDGASDEHDNLELDVENLIGGTGGDLIIGSNQDNILEGSFPLPVPTGAEPVCPPHVDSAYDGNDTILGMAGNDTLHGHGGSNLLVGGEGDDHIFADGNRAADTVDGGAGDDTAHVDVPGPGGNLKDTHSDVEHLVESPDAGDIYPV
jgi:Ca2+-binding RTX toxin-like protein